MICPVRDVPVYYETYGQGIPVLCIHGYSLDHRVMTGCLEPVFAQEASYRRIYVDLPGRGKTPSAAWINNADDLLALVTAFIQTVIPEGRFLLIGESYGGYLSMGLLRAMPQRIDGVMMICPGIFKNAGKENPAKCLLWESEDFKGIQNDAAAESFLRIAVVATPDIFQQYETYILSGITLADQEFLARYGNGGYWFSFDEELRALHFDKPSCILAGRQDHVAGYHAAYEMLECFPRATFAVLDCAGHNLQFENEPLFSQHVKDWLWRVGLQNES